MLTYADFNLHKGLQRVLAAKVKMFDSKEGVDWATAGMR
jgi:2-oxoglutarate dehydrogenase complex dehydrogenase (E1) component-like enzyme